MKVKVLHKFWHNKEEVLPNKELEVSDKLGEHLVANGVVACIDAKPTTTAKKAIPMMNREELLAELSAANVSVEPDITHSALIKKAKALRESKTVEAPDREEMLSELSLAGVPVKPDISDEELTEMFGKLRKGKL